LQDAGNTTTLSHYLALPEAAFLLTGLESFARGHVRRRGSSPKLVLWNNALVSALGAPSFDKAPALPEWWGRRGQKVPGLRAFRRQYPECLALVVGGEGMPLPTFFATPPSALFAA
jgi:hypothetical protein